MTNEKTKSSAYNFINNVLNGTAIAIVVALIPNAVLKAALTAHKDNIMVISSCYNTTPNKPATK